MDGVGTAVVQGCVGAVGEGGVGGGEVGVGSGGKVESLSRKKQHSQHLAAPPPSSNPNARTQAPPSFPTLLAVQPESFKLHSLFVGLG